MVLVELFESWISWIRINSLFRQYTRG